MRYPIIANYEQI